MRNNFLIFFVLFFLIFSSILYSNRENPTQWSLRIFFDSHGEWWNLRGEKVNFELKILFEGWLFKDNGDYGISYLKNGMKGKIFYWKATMEKAGEVINLSDSLKPFFDGGISIRMSGENLILMRILVDGEDSTNMILPSSKGFEYVERFSDYNNYLISGDNKIFFRDGDIKNEYSFKTEWEWKKKQGNKFSFHKVRAFMFIKPSY